MAYFKSYYLKVHRGRFHHPNLHPNQHIADTVTQWMLVLLSSWGWHGWRNSASMHIPLLVKLYLLQSNFFLKHLDFPVTHTPNASFLSIRSSFSQNSRFISRQKEMKNDVMPLLYLAFWQLSPINNRWLLVKLCRAMMMSLEFRNEAKYHEQGKKIVTREKMDLGIEDESVLVHSCKAYSTHHMDSKLESHVMHLICHMLESLSIPGGRPPLRIWLWPPILVYKVFPPCCGCSAIILPVPQEIHHYILQQLATMLRHQAQKLKLNAHLIWSSSSKPELIFPLNYLFCRSAYFLFADWHIPHSQMGPASQPQLEHSQETPPLIWSKRKHHMSSILVVGLWLH